MKAILRLASFLCIALLVAMPISINTNTEVQMNNIGLLFVNGIEVIDEDAALEVDGQLMFPLRTILEALGSTVIWESSTGNIYFDFDGVVYVCRFRIVERQNFPPLHFVLISNVQHINSTANNDFIQLNPMSADGSFKIIDGRTYLTQDTSQRLFEALGNRVNIDLESRSLRVYSNAE